ncbi:hypothetical protein [Sorangium cellulosum]|uniref:hypothetical protein n=1 Tax=Sorangium cellulosum TaxID=56 RepID=UPI0012DB3DC2|nr:hypothetical protein [Sorangium cellulosum]
MEVCATPEDEGCDGDTDCAPRPPWSRGYGGTGADEGASIASDPAGNYYVIGTFEGTIDFGAGPLTSAGGRDIFLLKLDPAGALLWSKRFGVIFDEVGRAVAVDGSGNVLLAGTHLTSETVATSFGGCGIVTPYQGEGVFVAKLDPEGNHIWSRGSVSPDAAQLERPFKQLVVDALGDAYVTFTVTGRFETTPSLAKLDAATGDILWSQPLAAAIPAHADHEQQKDEVLLAIDSAGDVVTTSASIVPVSNCPCVHQLTVQKLTTTGDVLWSRQFSPSISAPPAAGIGASAWAMAVNAADEIRRRHYEASISVFGLPHGEHVLTVTASDVTGASASAQRTVFIDAPPTVQILAPRHETVAHPTLRVATACVDDHPEDCTVRVMADIHGSSLDSVEIARGTSAVDTVVDLSAFDGKTFNLRFTVLDTWASSFLQGATVHVEGSPLLTAVDDAPGRILDFDASRILFINAETEFAVLDRATRTITRLMTVPYPYWLNASSRALLTRTGAVMEVPGVPSAGVRTAVYEWRDGALLRLAAQGRIAFVSGDYLAYSGSGTYLRNLASGTDELVLSATLDPVSFDVAESGLLTYVDGRSLYTHMAGVSTLLLRSGDEITRPVTDGLNVVFTKRVDRNVYQTLLATPSGELPLGVAPVAQPAGTDTGAYQLHGGYIAFLRGAYRSEQVWLRTPTGEQHQISFFAAASRLDDPPGRLGHDGISDAGEVMFLNPPKRYLGAPGAAPREISSQLGHARWFQGAWYVVMGNTLFRVDDGSSGTGGEGGSGGGAGGTGSFTDDGGMTSFAGNGDAVRVGSFAGASSTETGGGARIDVSSTGIGGAGSGVSTSATVGSSERPVGEPPMSGGCAVAAR